MSRKRRRFVIRNTTKTTLLASEAKLADSFLARLRGLLLAAKIRPGEGLIISPCNSIHMFGMLYAIDAVFVDHDRTVVGMVQSIWPMTVSPVFKKAHATIELPAGTISATNTKTGDVIDWEEIPA